MRERGCYFHNPGPCPDPKYATEHPFLECPLGLKDGIHNMPGGPPGLKIECTIKEAQCHYHIGNGKHCLRSLAAHKS